MINTLVESIINCEKALETIREQFNQDPLFSLQPVMERFDQKKKGFIDSSDLVQFCNDNQIECTHREMYFALKYMDKNKDGKLCFKDLTHSLLPKINRQSRVTTVLREPYHIQKQMYMPEQIEAGLTFFIGELLIYVREQQAIKQDLFQKENIYQILHAIDKSKNGFISISDFQQYFQLSDLDAQYFYQAAQQSSDIQLSFMELMDVFMHVDNQSVTYSSVSPVKRSAKNEQQQIQSSMSFSTLVNQNSKIQTAKIEPRFYNEDKEDISHFQEQDTIEKEYGSHESSKFVDNLAQSLESPKVLAFDSKENKKNYEYLYKMALHLKSAEELRTTLNQRSDFDAMVLFTFFDKTQKGSVNLRELQDGLKLFNVKADAISAQLLLKQFGNGSVMLYSQFANMVQQSCSETTFRKQKFSSTTIDYIRQLFQLLIDTELFHRKCNISGEGFFDSITNNQFLDESDLRKYFQDNKALPTNIEVRRLIARFNNNLYGDGRIARRLFIKYFQ